MTTIEAPLRVQSYLVTVSMVNDEVSFSLIFLLILQYSVFGSIWTAGGILGAIISGKTADLIGRRGVSFRPCLL